MVKERKESKMTQAFSNRVNGSVIHYQGKIKGKIRLGRKIKIDREEKRSKSQETIVC